MGLCNPHIGLSCLPFPVTPRAGSTALVCQSGNMGLQFLAFAEQQCIGIRGFCGSGNEAMVTIPDYLDAFEMDPLTRIVMLYMESIKDGRRFFEAARRVSLKEPVFSMPPAIRLGSCRFQDQEPCWMLWPPLPHNRFPGETGLPF